jgi:hypothetical protein
LDRALRDLEKGFLLLSVGVGSVGGGRIITLRENKSPRRLLWSALRVGRRARSRDAVAPSPRHGQEAAQPAQQAASARKSTLIFFHSFVATQKCIFLIKKKLKIISASQQIIFKYSGFKEKRDFKEVC